MNAKGQLAVFLVLNRTNTSPHIHGFYLDDRAFTVLLVFRKPQYINYSHFLISSFFSPCFDTAECKCQKLKCLD